jgi:CDP-glycerol glycerophosphotransferase
MPKLTEMLGSERVSVIVRMHPNLIGKVDTSSLVAYDGVYDGTMYHDMQELLSASDLLITDYSSSMFDFSLMGKPCMLYAVDAMQYDRGYYFNLRELPYPLSESEDELIDTLEKFDRVEYERRLLEFFGNNVGSKEYGHASEEIAKWMKQHSINK